MNKVSIQKLGEETEAIFFEKENGHQLGFTLIKGTQRVQVCETLKIDGNLFMNPMASVPWIWIEVFIVEKVNGGKKPAFYDWKTPFGKEFRFTKEDLNQLRKFLSKQLNGGSNG